jgi:hypothetical protein
MSISFSAPYSKCRTGRRLIDLGTEGTDTEVKVLDHKGATSLQCPSRLVPHLRRRKSATKLRDLEDAGLLKALVGAVVIPRALIDKA